jgi:hypothetical protein
MMTSPNPQTLAASRKRRFVFAALLVSILGGVLFLATRSRQVPTAPLPEVHRRNLEWRAGRWCAPGETNGFTGLLLDTYDNGAMKSRSMISNGLLHGLSEGWSTNGQLQVREQFREGVSHGLRTKWYASGAKLSEVMVVDGKLHGTFRRWHENGALAEAVELHEGQPDGLSKAYFASGYLKAQASLRNGDLLEQKSWKDGEVRDAGPATEGTP